jgi:hypothetical protein
VHGTNDVENQARFKATQVNRSFSRQKLNRTKKEKTNVAIVFLFLSILFDFVSSPSMAFNQMQGLSLLHHFAARYFHIYDLFSPPSHFLIQKSMRF